MTNSMQDDFQAALAVRTLMDRLQFMNLATASLAHEPWSSPVFYAVDEDLNFFWLSAPNARHSQNLQQNPQASIVIFDSTKSDWDGFGVYFTAQAAAIDENDHELLARAHNVSYARAGKTPGDPQKFTGDFPRKYYCARPTAAWINAVEYRQDIPVDIRREIPLSVLRSARSPNVTV